jgi:hypothetical protein
MLRYLAGQMNEQDLIDDLFQGVRDDEYQDIAQNLSVLKKVPEIVEARANAYRIANGDPLIEGTRAIKFPIMKQNDTEALTYFLVNYWKNFYANDAIAYNHNGTIRVVTVDDRGARQAPIQQNFTGFIDYASTPDPHVVIRSNALKYYIDDTGEPYPKYQMPEILFKTMGANVILGPCLADNHFIFSNPTRPPTVNSGNDGLLPLQDSHDYNNLKKILEDFQPTLIRVSGGTFSFSTMQPDYSPLRFRYSLPNFLLGEVLYKDSKYETPGKLENIGKVKVGRPLLDHPELWVKIQANNDYFFPYDTNRYYLPPGYEMYERADGVIIYRNPNSQIEFTFPLGSYMIVHIDAGGTITPPIKPTTRYLEINNVVKAKMERMAGVGANGLVPYVTFQTGNYQSSLQLVAYMANLKSLLRLPAWASLVPPPQGGRTKKLKRRRAAKSKSKSKSMSMFKSAKRAFYKMNKRNKTSRKH